MRRPRGQPLPASNGEAALAPPIILCGPVGLGLGKKKEARGLIRRPLVPPPQLRVIVFAGGRGGSVADADEDDGDGNGKSSMAISVAYFLKLVVVKNVVRKVQKGVS